ncbi:MAG: M1 family metallopeptidase [Chloracidobacterium sp.]|nr:M1 family metallopeptidase [Chloracidobacterium sp.]
MKRTFLITFSIFLLFSAAFGQRELGVRPTETGGPLLPEQAAFDVQSYDVALKVDPKSKTISGTTVMIAKVVNATDTILLHLDTPYKVDRIYTQSADVQQGLRYEHTDGKLRITFREKKKPGETFETIITYFGTPRVAPRPPWIGGIIWAKTPSGADWISVAMQNDGADLLFPVKDHPSDKPESATMRITVPDPLVAAGPGRLVETIKNKDGTSTYVWRMSNPIPNYSILFDAAPYRVIRDSVKSITGETIPIEFYILPESYENGAKLIEETKKYNAFYEKYLGPFPFRSEKLGIVETPHLGMEHSTHLAYGNKFQYNEHGYDWLQLHEFGHEWWSNLVTARDWKDFWIHEGFQSFMDTLYLEHLGKKDAYFESMRQRASRTRNMQPVAPRGAKFSYEVYLAGPDYVNSDGDIYGKGAVVLHTLRYLIGDDAFFRALRRMAYPTPAMEKRTDGSQTRLVDTEDFRKIAEQESKMDLGWFFEVYLRQPKLPKLNVRNEIVSGGSETPQKQIFEWEVPNDLPFPMPVEVEVDGKIQRVEMKNGKGSISFYKTPVIDPKGWILRAK